MYRSRSYKEALFCYLVRRLVEKALVSFYPVDKEAECLCYTSRKALR